MTTIRFVKQSFLQYHTTLTKDISMSEKQAKLNLKNKYSSNRKWVQATENHGFYSYPHSYYKELVDIVLRYR